MNAVLRPAGGEKAPDQRFLRGEHDGLHVLLPAPVHIGQLGHGAEKLVLADARALKLLRQPGGILDVGRGLRRACGLRAGFGIFLVNLLLACHENSVSRSPT